MTTVYLMRHSEPFGKHKGIEICDNTLLQSNKIAPLSIYGEELANNISRQNEYQNLDVVWSSDYARAMSTAKYFANTNNLKVNISSHLGERKHGIESWNDLPENFEQKQLEDEYFKMENGENQKETRLRMLNELTRIINENKQKRILIVSHATAISFLLKTWCEINYNSDYKYKNITFFNGKWEYCTTFKLEFNENNELIDIKCIKNAD